MNEKQERLVFIDLLFDLGFKEIATEEARSSRPSDPGRREFDRIFEGEHDSLSRATRASTIEIKIYGSYVMIQWITAWIRPDGGYPTYSYPIPKEWRDVALRLNQLIQLAEIKSDTGRTLHVPYDFSIPK